MSSTTPSATGPRNGAGLPAPPRSRLPGERQVAALMAELLGVPSVGPDDDFFALGGHSLLATRLVTRIRARLGTELPMRAVFERPTARTLSALLPEQRPAVPPIVPVERTGELPLSHAQERMWLLDQLESDNPSYNVPIALRLRGPLDPGRLRSALTAVGERHEVLRTRFEERDGQPVARAAEKPRIRFDQVRPGPGEAPERAALERAAADAREPFDLGDGPLVRAALTRLSEDEHLLAICTHHIVFDGWSVSVLIRDLHAAYTGEPQKPLPIQYADYAAWQTAWLKDGALDDQLAHWTSALADLPSALDLPTDRPRPATASGSGAQLHGRIDPETAQRLRALARAEGTTLFSALYAAFGAVLMRRSGQDSAVIGVPVANRGRAEAEDLIGFFVNTLPLPVRLPDDGTYRGLLTQVSRTALAAFDHQDVPFERLVEVLAPERDLSRNPLFQAMFTLQNTPPPPTRLGDLTVELLTLESGSAKFDLTLTVAEGDGLEVVLEYATDLFDPETARAVLDEYVHLCEGAAHRPGARLSTLLRVPAADREKLLVTWNATDRENTTADVVTRLRHFAEVTPDAVALTDRTTSLTYRRLWQRADALRRDLAGRGVGPGDLVLVLGDRGAAVTTAVLGILATGAAFVPVDVAMPLPRAAGIASRSGARFLVAEPAATARAHRLVEAAERPLTVVSPYPADAPAGGPPPTAFDGDSPAYVIHTSGSTGVPKGAVVHRLGMHNHLLAEIEELGLTAADTVVQNAGLAFDVSVWQTLVAFVVGGRSLVVADAIASDPVELFETAAREGATFLEVVPSLLRAALDAWDVLGSAPDPDRLRRLMVTGEALPPDLCRRWFARFPGVPLVNAYGPAECSDDVAQAVLAQDTPLAGARVPIGRPLRNTRLYVLDEECEPVPVGVPGELYVGGMGVGLGYLGDPRRTAAAFPPDPFHDVPGARMYRTGDVVRYLRDGQLEFLGRRDHQVKIRGQRIEPGEVEAAVRTLSGVRDAVVIADRSGPGGARLVAYVAGEVDPHAVRSALAGRLPSAMVPAAVVPLDALPLSANGKVDRAALPPAPVPEGDSYVPPRDAEETRLCALFAELLDLPRVGRYDDFFALGGHSLLATRLVARVRAAFGVALPLRVLFERPTPEGLRAALTGTDAARPAHAPVRTPVQRWFGTAEPSGGRASLLFCLPHAGGGASAYRDWRALAPADVEVVPVHLPGRETRLMEPARRDARELAEELADVLPAFADRPFGLFGHSMGALLAFELSHALTARGHRPRALFVSGLDAPHRRALPARPAHTLDDEALRSALRGLDGTPPDVLDSPELLQTLLPVLRADAAVTETYTCPPRPPLTVPVTVCTGRDDPTLDPERTAAWAELSSAPVVFETFPGGHFYLRAQAGALLRLLSARLRATG
ncbi:amino acid adenylation domain-containing protein [Streptomyces sp. NPDC044780]|uniref:amino acid adenylation domain-containing protein n=1 Tax=unclassified Streptomyces TaxID=2593676 RepID=UPI0033C8296A